MRPLLKDDQGVSIAELTIVSFIVALTMAIVMGLFGGLFGNIQVTYNLEDVERETRPVIREMIIHARQSIPRGDSGDLHPVAELDWDKLSFYSDRLPYDDGGAPELHTYELVSCSGGSAGGVCDLQLTVIPPDDP
ncbi:MAG: Tfp pilus assembly protein FimT/FimU, partial [Acidimicrobiia bacterium]